MIKPDTDLPPEHRQRGFRGVFVTQSKWHGQPRTVSWTCKTLS